MATRLYLSAGTAPVTPASATYSGAGGWDLPAAASAPAANLLMHPNNWATTAFAALISVAEAVATNATDVCIRRHVSQPLVGAQTISGTLRGQMQLLESATTMNALPQIVVKVISGDGATLRGTLYAGDTRTTAGIDEITTTLRNQKNPAPTAGTAGVVTLSGVAALNGDRILVESGVRANNTSSTSFTAQLRHGTNATPAGANDLGVGGTETTNLNPWVEFSQDLLLAPAFDQDSYRWRNDDGTETTATWKAAANATPANTDLDANVRLRFLLQNSVLAPTANLNVRLQYSLNGGAWTQVDAASLVARSTASATVADSTATTRQLGATGTFRSAEFDSGNGRSTCSFAAAALGDESEPEFCFQLRGADLAPGDSVALRLAYDDGSALTTYTNAPTVTVAAPPEPETFYQRQPLAFY